MRRVGMGLAAITLAGAAATWANAASPGVKGLADARADEELQRPAPVPGTFDFQLAQLDAKPAMHEGASAAPPPAPAALEAPVGAMMARRFVDAAWAFDRYTRTVGALDGGFQDGAGVSRAVSAAAAYEPAQLAQGAVAWGALAALQDVEFVEAVKAAAPDAASRAALAADLIQRPAAVLHLPGAREAALRVSDLVGRRGQTLVEAGGAVRKSSYAVQKSAWSKAALDKPAERLVEVKSLGVHRASAGDAETAELMKTVAGMRAGAGQSRVAPEGWRPTPAVARSVAFAALTLLGRTGEDGAAAVEPLLSTGQGEDCLKMAKLNLHQCLAVAGPRYEDLFCTGQHAVTDTGQCVVSTAGWTPSVSAAAVTPAAAPAPVFVRAAVAVPVAVAALDGPERASAFATPAAAVEPAVAAAPSGEAAAVLADAAPEPVAPRPGWSRPAPDEDEADLAPPRQAAVPARYSPSDAQEDRRAYAARDDRYGDRDRYDDRGRYGDRDGGGDPQEPPPPPRWTPYGGYGYGPNSASYGYGGYGWGRDGR